MIGGEYVRNGGNPVSNEELGRDAHWFDGDGMLSGVAFGLDETGSVEPRFVNQFVLSDVYLSSISSPRAKTPILPSIATLVNPVATLISITMSILRTIMLVILSFLPGSKQSIKKISVVNTSIWYHDGRALAGCESGPPMRVSLPELDTIGWYDGCGVEGEPVDQRSQDNQMIGGSGLIGWMKEWTTAHPKVDPVNGEMMLFHSTFVPPYVQYSVIPESGDTKTTEKTEGHRVAKKCVNLAVPGVTSAKMMHDFGVSSTHSVIMDLPLSLDPLNLLKNRSVVEYDPSKPARFGVFPRHGPDLVNWFETDACCIFHTVNTWDNIVETGRIESVRMLACRLTSASTVFSAGNIAGPKSEVMGQKRRPSFLARYDSDYATEHLLAPPEACTDDIESSPCTLSRQTSLVQSEPSSEPLDYHSDFQNHVDPDVDQCRLYYYEFDLSSGRITSQYALAKIPFEFASTRFDVSMKRAKYVYGCSTTCASFGAALGKSAKIDIIVKVNVESLIAKGENQKANGLLKPVDGCVDQRSLLQVLEDNDPQDDISIFQLPEGWFAQEPQFVARQTGQSEDDGFLLFYAFDEKQLNDQGDVSSDEDVFTRAKSELWVIDAKDMKTIIAQVKLPQRVPYGLHGSWFSADQIKKQRPFESIRSTASVLSASTSNGIWMSMRTAIERFLA